MRIAFFGLPIAALLLSADGHEVVFAAICRSDALGTRRLRRKLGADRIVIRPSLTSHDVVDRIRALAPDLIVSWFWTTQIPAEILSIAPSVGVHPSLLPRHRGPDPVFWAIDSGDAQTGVTAHCLDREYDTGAILGQAAINIDPRWDSWALAKRLDRPSLNLLRATVAGFASGAPPTPIAQCDGDATDAPAPAEEMLELRWQWSTEKIERRVRAAGPWPGAFTVIGDTEVIVTRVEATDRYPKGLEPGEAVIVDGYAVVATGTGAIRLLAGRDENDEPRTLTFTDFVSLVLRLRRRTI